MSSEHLEIKDLVDPNHTALLLVECQNGVIGEKSSFPALAEASSVISGVVIVAVLETLIDLSNCSCNS